MAKNIAQLMVDTLVQAGVERVYGLPGDSLNGLQTRFENKKSFSGFMSGYGEIAVGLNVMPNPWINFRPEIRGDFASEPSFGSVRSTNRERSQFTVAFDIILKFH